MKINSFEMSFEQPNEVIVKNEPIFDNQSISETSEATSSNNQPNNKIKDETIDILMLTSKEIVVKAEEEKFSVREEFSNKISIAILNEETTTSSNDDNLITNTNQPTTSNDDTINLK